MSNGLKDVKLESFKPSMNDEEKENAVSENFSNLRTFLGRTGCSVLVNKFVQDNGSFANTTEDVLLGFTAAFQTTGGLVQVAFSTSAQIGTAAAYVRFNLYVDDVMVDSCIVGGVNNIDALLRVTLGHTESLGSGIHKIRTTKNLSAGTVTLGNNSTHTKLTVTEILL